MKLPKLSRIRVELLLKILQGKKVDNITENLKIKRINLPKMLGNNLRLQLAILLRVKSIEERITLEGNGVV